MVQYHAHRTFSTYEERKKFMVAWKESHVQNYTSEPITDIQNID